MASGGGRAPRDLVQNPQERHRGREHTAEGGKEECLICKVPCRTVLLSKHTDADIQALFMGIDGLCQKYSRETCQISEFQEKHRKRLLTFYREKITKLEESLRKSVLRMEQLQSMRLSQQTAFSAIKTPVSTPSAKPGGHPLLPLDSSASDRVEFMQVDHTPSPMRKPEVAVGPARISLISPPQHGRMGGNTGTPLMLSRCIDQELRSDRRAALCASCPVRLSVPLLPLWKGWVLISVTVILSFFI
ncbi:probable E3 SUMO-protein ligase RNF212 isoform X4 [Mirounga leonina]|uniref:probable E3 SUMO-protein ligase RNF212 isoform X4 n=1 Tax=Mirounga leonina TaxID=9715 RepID=UPI00156C3E95|nr:probable E3 SUMO-protein ligase RNF212 isoform X4 [Mirounga leonina]